MELVGRATSTERRAHRRRRDAAPADALLRRPVRRPHRARALRRPPLPSVKGLTRDGVLTDADPLEAEVKRAMIAHAEEAFLLIDDSKLQARGLNADRPRRDLAGVFADAAKRRSCATLAPPAWTSALERGAGMNADAGPIVALRDVVEVLRRRARAARRQPRAAPRRGARRSSARTAPASRRSSGCSAGVDAAATRASVLVDGEPVDFHGPADARDAGIAVIYQEPTLFPDLSVAENVFMGRQPLGERRVGSTAARCTARSRGCSTGWASGSTPTGRCAGSRSPTSRSSRSPRR